jgi:hypothetical protein
MSDFLACGLPNTFSSTREEEFFRRIKTMKRKQGVPLALAMIMSVLLFAAGSVLAQTTDSTTTKSGAKHGPGFVDKNNDGVNDRHDADGDGIPNRLDPDFEKSNKGQRFFIDQDGDGINDLRQDFDGDGIMNWKDADYLKTHKGLAGRRMGFIDANGDGINDLIQDDDGDGIRNVKDPDWIRPDGLGRRGGKGQGTKK